ncbi:MAG: methylmalonyl Co-A mutase-associated GTPase MeaB [Anaerolineae bacterium]|jgi:LAO/AO transport system kinase
MNELIEGVRPELVEGVLAGRRRAIARAISLIENNGAEAQATLAVLHPHTGRAHIVGVTGPPGSGKSTLVNALALHFRRIDPPKTVGIIAVDPTSPFSGGAILGDRIRMRDLAGDRGIFIRSMASRGNLGGLAWATADAVKVLDAAGFDLIVVETVGAGQAEVDIARTAHTTVVVEVPGLGDDIQAIKAGILEIADVFAVNKADLEGAAHAVMALRMMLDLNVGGAHTVMHHGRLMEAVMAAQEAADTTGASTWRPPIHKTVATRREGIVELAGAILAHRAHLEETGRLAWRERERAAAELETIVQQVSLRQTLARTDRARLATLIDQIVLRELDPYTASQRLLAR